MKKYLLLVTLLISVAVSAQIGIGTTSPNASAALDVVSTDKGVLVPRMTQAERNAITVGAAQTGLLIYQTDVSPGFYYYNGTIWTTFGSGGSGWSLTGDAGTSPGGNNLGTTDAQDFVIAANNTEAMRVASGGNMGIGTTTPSTLFHFVGTQTFSAPFAFNDGFETNVAVPFDNFTTSGAGGDWSVTSGAGEFNTGSFGAGSGSGVDSSQSVFELTVSIPVGGSAYSFDYRVDSENNYDWLEFFIDADGTGNDYIDRWSGTVPWANHAGTLTAGVHTLSWVYDKDVNTPGGLDRAFVDNVVIASIAEITDVFRIDDGNQANGYVLTSDATGVATWQPSPISSTDNDWVFTGTTTVYDHIYHIGSVQIGVAPLVSRNLNIYNGTTSGSTLGVGSVEFIQDGIAELKFYYNLLPLFDGSENLGSPGKRWLTVYTDLVSRLADVKRMSDIQPLHYGLTEIMKLNPITFQWKEEKVNNFLIPEKDKSTKIGFSAQELLEVLPEVVKNYHWKEYEETPGVLVKKQTEYLSVNYSEIIPVAIKAIQEQQLRIEAIRAENENIKLLIEKL